MNNKYVLYIEDDPDQLNLVQQLLERDLPGVIVDVCCTSHGAEKFLNTRCYDLIIADVNLPGELGTTIAEKILERDRSQPIYLMSEYTGANVREDAARIGLELQRKFSAKAPAVFVQEIKQMLDKRPCDSSTAAAPGGLGETAEGDQRGRAAATRENPADATNDDSAAVRSRPSKAIQLTSPCVLAARALL